MKNFSKYHFYAQKPWKMNKNRKKSMKIMKLVTWKKSDWKLGKKLKKLFKNDKNGWKWKELAVNQKILKICWKLAQFMKKNEGNHQKYN